MSTNSRPRSRIGLDMQSIDDVDSTKLENKGKEPKYSPIFLSPGGTFTKAEKPDLKLTPEMTLTAAEIESLKQSRLNATDKNHDNEDNDDNDDSKQSGHAVVDSAISRLEKLSLASSDVIDNDDDDEGGGGGGDNTAEVQRQSILSASDSAALSAFEVAKATSVDNDEIDDDKLVLTTSASTMSMHEMANTIDPENIGKDADEMPYQGDSTSSSIQKEMFSWGVKKDGKAFLGLFGGAITCVLPDSFEDVSSIRQVPDHQEVFVDKNSDMSFILEILQSDDNLKDSEAAAFHFNDLATCNEAKDVQVHSSDVMTANEVLPAMDGQFSVCALTGSQKVKKFRSEDASLDRVHIFLVVVRLPAVTTDVLITINIPLTGDTSVINVPVATFRPDAPELVFDEGSTVTAETEKLVTLAITALKLVMGNFNVTDWSLFA